MQATEGVVNVLARFQREESFSKILKMLCLMLLHLLPLLNINNAHNVNPGPKSLVSRKPSILELSINAILQKYRILQRVSF